MRQAVLVPRAAGGDELVANAAREREFGDPIAVHVAKLAVADTELDPAEPVPAGFNPGPRADHPADSLG